MRALISALFIFGLTATSQASSQYGDEITDLSPYSEHLENMWRPLYGFKDEGRLAIFYQGRQTFSSKDTYFRVRLVNLETGRTRDRVINLYVTPADTDFKVIRIKKDSGEIEPNKILIRIRDEFGTHADHRLFLLNLYSLSSQAIYLEQANDLNLRGGPLKVVTYVEKKRGRLERQMNLLLQKSEIETSFRCEKELSPREKI